MYSGYNSGQGIYSGAPIPGYNGAGVGGYPTAPPPGYAPQGYNQPPYNPQPYPPNPYSAQPYPAPVYPQPPIPQPVVPAYGMAPAVQPLYPPGQGVDMDCQILHAAMKGAGTDENAIINIVCSRNAMQRAEIRRRYIALYGKDLIKKLKEKTN